MRASQEETLRLVEELGGECDAKEVADRLGFTVHSAERRLLRLTKGPGFPPLERLEAAEHGWPEVPVYRRVEEDA